MLKLQPITAVLCHCWAWASFGKDGVFSNSGFVLGNFCAKFTQRQQSRRDVSCNIRIDDDKMRNNNLNNKSGII
ncbi:hypothetical protein C3B47_14240 [Flavobacterium columnare]|nr:hypothetical protein [Flavobacterium columnare]MBF6655792.1 hypothetical protein [Flavobacterium columnare]MBF6658646.1 hypothetical protein [Flavobacterium columnare]